MALSDMTTERIRARVVQYNRAVEEVRGDARLTAWGRQQDLQALYDRAKADVAGMRAKEGETSSQRRVQLERRLFGITGSNPSEVISHRDAQDRVASVKTSDELLTLMQDAEMSGDTTLLRAGFTRAVRGLRDPLSERSGRWRDIVDEYVRQTPSAAADWEEYQALTSSASLTANAVANLGLSVMRPHELDTRLPDGERETSSARLTREQTQRTFGGAPR